MVSSRIPDPDADFLPSRIPDPGSRIQGSKRHPILDPGSGSATLFFRQDERVSLMSELLVGIRVIKYFNWQGFFTDRINMKRDEELKYLAGTVSTHMHTIPLQVLCCELANTSLVFGIVQVTNFFPHGCTASILAFHWIGGKIFFMNFFTSFLKIIKKLCLFYVKPYNRWLC
jgi:hypothetical protein